MRTNLFFSDVAPGAADGTPWDQSDIWHNREEDDNNNYLIRTSQITIHNDDEGLVVVETEDGKRFYTYRDELNVFAFDTNFYVWHLGNDTYLVDFEDWLALDNEAQPTAYEDEVGDHYLIDLRELRPGNSPQMCPIIKLYEM